MSSKLYSIHRNYVSLVNPDFPYDVTVRATVRGNSHDRYHVSFQEIGFNRRKKMLSCWMPRGAAAVTDDSYTSDRRRAKRIARNMMKDSLAKLRETYGDKIQKGRGAGWAGGK